MTNPIHGVSGTSETSAINPSGGAKSGPASSASPGPGTSIAADSANVTQTQTLLETINSVVSALPTVDPNQVSALQQAIATGSYKIDPNNLAKQLIDTEKLLADPMPKGE